MKTTILFPSGALLLSSLSVWLTLDRPTASAWDFTEQEVRTAVQTWVRFETTDARPEAEIEKLEPYAVDRRTVAYIAHLAGRGYCLCGANELVLPVYLYSPRGSYRKDNPSCQCILIEIAQRTRALTERAVPKSEAVQSLLENRTVLWQQLFSGSPLSKPRSMASTLGEPDKLELPLTCEWDQFSPYNDQCPVLTPGTDEHCYVGCNATAAAQLMYYWKWPPTGTGQTNAVYHLRFRSSWDEVPLAVKPLLEHQGRP